MQMALVMSSEAMIEMTCHVNPLFRSLTIVLSMFIHNICLKRNRETTASNLFHASLLRRVVGELHFSKLVVDLK